MSRNAFPEAVLELVEYDDDLDAALDVSGFSLDALQQILGGTVEDYSMNQSTGKAKKPTPKPKK